MNYTFYSNIIPYELHIIRHYLVPHCTFQKWRDGRGASQNIIPASTGAAKAVGKVC